MIQYIALGGVTMIPVLLVSVIALAIVIEKFFSFQKFRRPRHAFLLTVYDLVKKRDWEQALRECKKSDYPVALVFQAGLEEATKEVTDLRTIEEALQLKGNELIHRLEMGLKFLGSVITLLPFLGLVGTMYGLIIAFQRWEALGSNVTISDLAGGIYHAMITTATGLTLMVPYYVIYNFFVAKVDTIELRFSQYATDFISRIRNSSAADLPTEKTTAKSYLSKSILKN